MSDIHLIRDRLVTDGPTMGRLYCGQLVFETLEVPWKDNAQDISCIPKGRYRVVIADSTRFQGPMPRLEGVPGRTGILFHPGHQVANTEGCILLGMRWDTTQTIAGQVPAFGRFYAWLTPMLEEGEVWCEVSYGE